MHPDSDIFLAFLVSVLGAAFLAGRFGIRGVKETWSLIQAIPILLLLATSLACCMVFITCHPSAEQRKATCLICMQVVQVLCIGIEPVHRSFRLLHRVDSKRAWMILAGWVVICLAILATGLWRYITTDYQWLWVFIMMQSVTPLPIGLALGIMVQRRWNVLHQILKKYGILLAPVLLAIGLALTAATILPAKSPILHLIQHSVQFLLGLLVMCVLAMGNMTDDDAGTDPDCLRASSTASSEQVVNRPADDYHGTLQSLASHNASSERQAHEYDVTLELSHRRPVVTV